MGVVDITPFNYYQYAQTNAVHILADRGNGVISMGLKSITALSLSYKGKGRTHIGLFNDSKPPTTMSVFSSMDVENRIDVILRAISMKNNVDAITNKKSENYKLLISIVEHIIEDVMEGTFREDDYKYSLIHASKSIVRTLQRYNVTRKGIMI
jgi:hypothetical protein